MQRRQQASINCANLARVNANIDCCAVNLFPGNALDVDDPLLSVDCYDLALTALQLHRMYDTCSVWQQSLQTRRTCTSQQQFRQSFNKELTAPRAQLLADVLHVCQLKCKCAHQTTI